MKFLLTNPGFYIFGKHIAWYGVLMASAMLVAVVFCCYLAKRRNLKADNFVGAALWAIPLAVIGARLYYIAFSGREWTFLEAIRIWDGGVAIYGGIIGGVIGLLIHSLISKKNFFDFADVIAPALILAQAIGRWGNFINQEAYGWEVTNPALFGFPFSVYIEKCTQAGCECSGSGWHLATFFFESYFNLVGFVILFLLLIYSQRKGIVVAGYMIYYGIVRAVVEGFRTDSLYIGNSTLRVSQLLSIILIAVGVGMMIYFFIKCKKQK